MGQKRLYELYCGAAPQFPVTTDLSGERRDLKEGDTIEHEWDLAKMWPAKFVAVDRTQELHGGSRAQRKRMIRQRVTQETADEQDVDVPQAETHAEVTLDGDDVTANFPLAKSNDLVVSHGKAGYTIHDGDKVVNDKPIRAKKDVEAKLRKYTTGEK